MRRLKRFGTEGGFAVVDACDDDVFCALQFRARKRDVGGRAFGADPHTVGLGKFVVVVGADRHPFRAGRDFKVAGPLRLVKRCQERASAVEFTARAVVDVGPHAVVGCAAQDGVRYLGRAAVGKVVAHRIAAARVGEQHHLTGPGGLQHFVDLGGQVLHVLGGGGAAVLRFAVVVTRQRVGHVDSVQTVARPAVGLKPPQRGRPQSGGVAVAVYEDDGGRWSARSGAGASAEQGDGG